MTQFRSAMLGLCAICFLASPSLCWSKPGDVVAAESPFSDYKDAEWVSLEGSNGQKFLTAILRPKGAGPFPVVVVLHGGEGLDRGYMSVARNVTEAGFLVVVGCWFNVLGFHGPCSEATPENDVATDPANNSGKELIAFARTLADARADRVGIYGFSRGGVAALWAASTGADVQAVVVDAPAHVLPGGYKVTPKPLEVVANLSAPVLIMHGTADRVIPIEQSYEYERAARALGKQVTTLYVEGGGHMVSVGFGSDVARQKAIDFLKAELMR